VLDTCLSQTKAIMKIEMKVTNRLLYVLTVPLLLASAVNAQQKSDRERAGLLGMVKTVVSAYTFVDEENGKESAPHSIQTIAYNRNGKKIKETPLEGCDACSIVKTTNDTEGRVIEEAYYRDGKEESLFLRIGYTLDHAGKRIGADYHDASGHLYRKWKYTYEYDSRGNWIKQMASMYDSKFFDGKTKFVLREVYYRTIKYY